MALFSMDELDGVGGVGGLGAVNLQKLGKTGAISAIPVIGAPIAMMRLGKIFGGGGGKQKRLNMYSAAWNQAREEVAKGVARLEPALKQLEASIDKVNSKVSALQDTAANTDSVEVADAVSNLETLLSDATESVQLLRDALDDLGMKLQTTVAGEESGQTQAGSPAQTALHEAKLIVRQLDGPIKNAGSKIQRVVTAITRVAQVVKRDAEKRRNEELAQQRAEAILRQQEEAERRRIEQEERRRAEIEEREIRRQQMEEERERQRQEAEERRQRELEERLIKAEEDRIRREEEAQRRAEEAELRRQQAEEQRYRQQLALEARAQQVPSANPNYFAPAPLPSAAPVNVTIEQPQQRHEPTIAPFDPDAGGFWRSSYEGGWAEDFSAPTASSAPADSWSSWEPSAEMFGIRGIGAAPNEIAISKRVKEILEAAKKKTQGIVDQPAPPPPPPQSGVVGKVVKGLAIGAAAFGAIKLAKRVFKRS